MRQGPVFRLANGVVLDGENEEASSAVEGCRQIFSIY